MQHYAKIKLILNLIKNKHENIEINLTTPCFTTPNFILIEANPNQNYFLKNNSMRNHLF